MAARIGSQSTCGLASALGGGVMASSRMFQQTDVSLRWGHNSQAHKITHLHQVFWEGFYEWTDEGKK
jgi:hypothetical protein